MRVDSKNPALVNKTKRNPSISDEDESDEPTIQCRSCHFPQKHLKHTCDRSAHSRKGNGQGKSSSKQAGASIKAAQIRKRANARVVSNTTDELHEVTSIESSPEVPEVEVLSSLRPMSEESNSLMTEKSIKTVLDIYFNKENSRLKKDVAKAFSSFRNTAPSFLSTSSAVIIPTARMHALIIIQAKTLLMLLTKLFMLSTVQTKKRIEDNHPHAHVYLPLNSRERQEELKEGAITDAEAKHSHKDVKGVTNTGLVLSSADIIFIKSFVHMASGMLSGESLWIMDEILMLLEGFTFQRYSTQHHSFADDFEEEVVEHVCDYVSTYFPENSEYKDFGVFMEQEETNEREKKEKRKCGSDSNSNSKSKSQKVRTVVSTSPKPEGKQRKRVIRKKSEKTPTTIAVSTKPVGWDSSDDDISEFSLEITTSPSTCTSSDDDYTEE